MADDGTKVPISIVHRRGVPRDGSAPCVLYGYGSYEASMDPWFSVLRLPLLERGCVFAVAHVRGGGECGRRWYDDGKLLHKRNTFTDFVACARHLCATGFTSPERLAARGGSAGGLLMGAIANLAPELFAAVARRSAVRRRAQHHPRPDTAVDGHGVGGVGQPDRVARDVRLHEVVLAVREHRGEGVPGHPRDRGTQRSAGQLPRARQVGGEAAGDKARRPTARTYAPRWARATAARQVATTSGTTRRSCSRFSSTRSTRRPSQCSRRADAVQPRAVGRQPPAVSRLVVRAGRSR